MPLLIPMAIAHTSVQAYFENSKTSNAQPSLALAKLILQLYEPSGLSFDVFEQLVYGLPTMTRAITSTVLFECSYFISLIFCENLRFWPFLFSYVVNLV